MLHSVITLPVSPPGICSVRGRGCTLSGHLYLVEDFRDYLVGSDVVGLCFVGEADAVTEHIVANGTHILRDYITALAQEGIRTGGACQRYGGTGRRSECDDASKVVEPRIRQGKRVANTMSTIYRSIFSSM